MNPPPLPKLKKANALPRQLALASLLAPGLALGVSAAIRAANANAEPARATHLILGGVSLLLIGSGFVSAIVALASIPRHGARGILGRGIAGLILNGLLLAILVVGFLHGVSRSARNRQANQDIKVVAEDMRQSLRESYDPEKGVTNLDSAKLDRLAREFKDAAGKMSGDEAIVMKANADYLGAAQKEFKSYQVALQAFTDAQVLDLATLTEKTQIASRREVVRRFLEANTGFETVLRDADKMIRTNLVKARLETSRIEKAMQAYNSSAGPQRSVTLQIRECDRQMGESVLAVLELLETQWGQWRYHASLNEITFSEAGHNKAYENLLGAIEAEGQKQVKLQGLLVNPK
ncbi:MAG TPA: hypothetical protein VFZ59_17505 [Verrucomicrobiae bacterium]|nr:hypothetical protein [Verrucomicrobiae bacterium]